MSRHRMRWLVSLMVVGTFGAFWIVRKTTWIGFLNFETGYRLSGDQNEYLEIWDERRGYYRGFPKDVDQFLISRLQETDDGEECEAIYNLYFNRAQFPFGLGDHVFESDEESRKILIGHFLENLRKIDEEDRGQVLVTIDGLRRGHLWTKGSPVVSHERFEQFLVSWWDGGNGKMGRGNPDPTDEFVDRP